MLNNHIYNVSGMHCPSCKLIIEGKLIQFPGIRDVRASVSGKTVTVDYEGSKPSTDQLNDLLEGYGYVFSEPEKADERTFFREYRKPSAIIITVAAGLFLLFTSGISSTIMVSDSSSYGAFLLFGLVAGVSSCAALTCGIVIAGSARWNQQTQYGAGMFGKTLPQILFNAGRVFSYGLFGALLGYAGETIKISPIVYNTAVIAVSILMIGLSLQMLGFSSFATLSFPLPERLSRFFRNIGNGSMTINPFLSGILTLLIPCGFTLVAEGAAILSGNALQGFFIMTSFVIGTMPALMGIGMLSSKLSTNSKTAPLFLKTSGVLVLLSVIWNLAMQFAPQVGITGPKASVSFTAAPGTTLISTVYSDARDISPSTFTVKRGQAVRFEVYPLETSHGCMSTILVPGLWNRPEPIVKGKKIVMQFTPAQSGIYRITCAMGVPRGAVIVR